MPHGRDRPHVKALVRRGLDNGRVVIPKSHATARMEERHITALEIEACLLSGSLRSDGLHPRGWRYRAEGRGVCVIFAVDVDDNGNLVVVISTWRLS